MAIALTTDQLDQLRHQAQLTYPEECCGLLLGNLSGQTTESSKQVREIWPTPNVWQAEVNDPLAQATDLINDSPRPKVAPSKRNRFAIDPQEMLSAQQTARQRQLAIIGIYHSHPNGTAQPSEYDRAIAWPQYSYMIIAIQPAGSCEILSWCLNGDRQFQPEAIRIATPFIENPFLD